MTKIGTGYIEVSADLSKFWRQVERDMGRLDGQGKRVGKSLGKSIGDGVSGGGADRGIARMRSGLTGLDRDSRVASKGFAGLAAAIDGGNNGIRNAARNIDSFGGAFNGGVAAVGGLRISLALLVPALVAFGGATVAAASALGPLIGLAGAGANSLLALAQGFAAVRLATAGIGDALKEQTTNHLKSGAAAASSAGQQRAAARAIQSAQDGVRDAMERLATAEDDVLDAQKDATKAQKALTKARTQARRALTDMRADLEAARVAEQQSTMDLRDARRALAELQAGASQEDLADAARTVTEAIHGQEQAVLSLEKAQENLNELLAKSANAERNRAAVAEALARAQQNLARVEADANATYDERTHALQLVADATQAANAANVAATVTELDRRQAVHDVTSAQDALTASQANAIAVQKDLAALQAGASDEDKRAALLDVRDAELQLAEAMRDRARQEKDTAAALKAGVEGSEEVVDAKEAIASADQRVEDAEKAVRDAHRDVTRATQALSDAQLSAKEGMVAAAAAAANLNEKMNSLPPAAQAFVRQLIAMKPLLDKLRDTASAGFFPGATAGLNAAAGSFGSLNKVIGQTSIVMGDAARKSGELVGSPAFGRDLEVIGGNNARVLGTLGEALRHVISALRHVMVAAGPLTQWLADVTNKWALNAAEAAKAGRENGKMAAFFERTRAVVERLGSILGHLASGLLGLGKAGTKTGNEIWASIDRAAGRFDEWANSAKGQAALHDFFRRARDLAAAMIPVLAGAAKAIGQMSLYVLPLTAALKLLGPYANEAVTALIAYKLAVFAAGVASNLATAALWLMNVALRANPIGLVVTALTGLALGLVYAYEHVEFFRKAVDNTFSWIKDHWPLLLSILTGPIGAAVIFIVRRWDTVKSATQSTWNAVKSAIVTPIRAARDLLNGVISGIGNRIETGWASVKSATTTAWVAVRDAILGPIRGARDAIEGVVDGIGNRLETGWKAITKGVTGFAENVKNGILKGIEGGVNLVIGFVNTIIDVVNKLPFIDNIKKVAKVKFSSASADDPQALAQGGVVNRPMAIVGEEAPRHKEFVVPTNPAYRGRAIGLTQQLMSELGMTTPGYAIGGIIGKGLSGAWDLLKGGVGSITKLLPDADVLPKWLKGIGAGLVKEVASWVKAQLGLGGGKGSKGLAGVMKAALDRPPIGTPYLYGGGHGGSIANGVDCSGGVSYALMGGDLLGSPITTDGLKVYGEAGDGKAITIGVRGSTGRNAHTMMKIAGKYFESGSGHGWQEVSGWASPGFPIHRHPAGLAMGGLVEDAIARALDPDIVGWGLAKGGVLPHAGSFGGGGIVGGPVGAPATAVVHGGEVITERGTDLIAALHAAATEMRALRASGMPGVMNAIADHTLERGGQESHRRHMTAGNPAKTAIVN